MQKQSSKRSGLDVRTIIEKLGVNPKAVIGSLNRFVYRASDIKYATEGCICFCKPKYISFLKHVYGCVIFLQRDCCFNYASIASCNTLIFVDNLRLYFSRAMRCLYPPYVPPKIKIGSNVEIGEGTRIGTDGFGYVRDNAGKLEGFFQIAGVVIMDNVRIGANCTIDRGTLVDTVIGEGTKMDNMIHIGHNCQIGDHCDIRASAMFSGSVRVGNYVTIGPGSKIMNDITIGDNAFIGLGSVVLKDVPANMVVAGVPARVLRKNEYRF